jgi:hypothetical protein
MKTAMACILCVMAFPFLVAAGCVLFAFVPLAFALVAFGCALDKLMLRR